MSEKVVAKMQCHTNQPQANSTDGFHSVTLGALYAGYEADKLTENAIFGKWTPFAECRMSIANPAANAFFKEGKRYYVTFMTMPGCFVFGRF